MLKTFLIFAVVLYLSFMVIVYFFSDRLIFFPPVRTYNNEQLEIVLVPTQDDMQIATLYLPNPKATYTILYSHGNAEDLGYLSGLLEQMREAGFSVIAYDYRGYGMSTAATPSAKAVHLDIAGVYDYATQTLAIPPAQLILYGRSVGSGPAIDLATQQPVAGLIIEGGFVSAFRVVTQITLLPFDKFPNLRNILKVQCPVLIIHGTEDEVISPWHGQKLFEAAHEPKYLLEVEGAGHNDIIPTAGEQYWKKLREFAQILK
jgi:fermentation-respiration switch protein FrsA (DUF1100 family)